MKWNRKDFIGLQDASADEMWYVLEVAKKFKKEIVAKTVKKVPKFENRNFVTLFYQASTRTRFSFEIAAKSLGLNVMNFVPGAASVSKGESLYDTVKTLEAMGVDVFAIRHGLSGSAKFVAENSLAHVINAGDGVHEHPTQALLDIFTIWENKGKVRGSKSFSLGTTITIVQVDRTRGPFRNLGLISSSVGRKPWLLTNIQPSAEDTLMMWTRPSRMRMSFTLSACNKKDRNQGCYPPLESTQNFTGSTKRD